MDKLREKIAKIIDSENEFWAGKKCNFPYGQYADQILAAVKQEGYVKLADDQSLPECPEDRARRC